MFCSEYREYRVIVARCSTTCQAKCRDKVCWTFVGPWFFKQKCLESNIWELWQASESHYPGLQQSNIQGVMKHLVVWFFPSLWFFLRIQHINTTTVVLAKELVLDLKDSKLCEGIKEAASILRPLMQAIIASFGFRQTKIRCLSYPSMLVQFKHGNLGEDNLSE